MTTRLVQHEDEAAKPGFPNAAERSAEDAILGVLTPDQLATLRDLKRLYYALLGPQQFLEQVTKDIRPVLPNYKYISPSTTHHGS